MRFSPRAMALRERFSRNDAQGKLQIQLADTPLDCEHYLSSPYPLDEGLFATLLATDALVGVQNGRPVTLSSRVRDANGHLTTGVGFSANAGTLELTRVIADRIDGSVDFPLGGSQSNGCTLNGNFSVERCD